MQVSQRPLLDEGAELAVLAVAIHDRAKRASDAEAVARRANSGGSRVICKTFNMSLVLHECV